MRALSLQICGMHSQRLLLTLALLAAIPALATPVPRIEGLGSDLIRQVTARAPAEGIRCDSPRWVVRTWARDLENEIRRALRARSYYGPELNVTLGRDEDCWQVHIVVERGEQTLLRGFQLEILGEAEDDPAFAALAENLSPRIGRPFREDAYEALKRGLRRVALERGYFDSRFTTSRVDVYPEELAADVTLTFATGVRYHFGETRIDVDPDMLSDSMLDRFRLWEPGTPYTTADIERLRRRLLQAGYFESVEVNPQLEVRADGIVDVDVGLGLRPRHEVSGGVGFVTDFGPRIKSSYENRYLNRRGHQGGVRVNLSPVLQELSSDYRMPLRGDDAWLVVDATVNREDTDTAESIAQAIGVRRIRGGPWGTRLTESLNLQREDFDVASDDDVAILLMPGLALSKTRQIQTRPLEIGWRLDGQIRGAASPLSSTTFLQLYGRASIALPLGDRARFLGRLEVGATAAKSLSELPTSVRYFAGGDRSIRGYKLDALGPTDDQGEISGGRHLAVAGVEFERMVADNWSVAVFADSGGAFNTFSDAYSSGIGLGVRWLSPVGPIRIDLAHPLDDSGTSVRLHIGVGSTFQ